MKTSERSLQEKKNKENSLSFETSSESQESCKVAIKVSARVGFSSEELRLDWGRIPF